MTEEEKEKEVHHDISIVGEENFIRFDQEMAQALQQELNRKGKGFARPSVQFDTRFDFEEIDIPWTNYLSTPGDPISQGFHGDGRDENMDLRGGHFRQEEEEGVAEEGNNYYEDVPEFEEDQEDASEEEGVPEEFVTVEHAKDYNFENDGYSNIPTPENDSDYAPSEGIRSIHSDDERSDDESSDVAGSFPDYVAMKDISKVPVLDIGVKFADAREFRWAVKQNAIYHGFDYSILKNDSDRVTLKCKSCTRRIHASYDKNQEYFQIKTLQGEHSCEAVTTNSRATSSWSGRKYGDYWRSDPGMSLKTLQTSIHKELQLDVSHQLVSAKKEAFRIIDGLVKDQYHRLHDYAGVLLEKHPGSVIKLSPHRPIPDDPLHFRRFYIGFAELVKGFLDGCRPFIGLDGCHLKNGQSSILLSAVSLDGNNQMYPISYAIVEGETRETWTWFLENLMQSLGVHSTRITFMSDRQKV